jgi:hypothetical protein
MTLVNEVELGRLLKRTRIAIRQAVAAGRLTQRPDGLFDRDEAILEWTESTQHEKGHNNMHGPVLHPGGPLPELPSPEIPSPSETRASAYGKARAGEKIYDALLKKLRYEERAGNLTPVVDVENARFVEFRTLREACFNIPSRIAALLATETDVERCEQMLEAELTRVFLAYAEGKLAAA